MMQQTGLNLSNTGAKHLYDRKNPTIGRKKFIKIQNLIKLKASPFHGTVQLQINCKAMLFVSFSFTNSLFARDKLKGSLISFSLLCVLKRHRLEYENTPSFWKIYQSLGKEGDDFTMNDPGTGWEQLTR